mgnify:FL=1
MSQEDYLGIAEEVLRRPDGKKRTKNIQVRVTPEQHAMMFNSAKSRGFVTISHFLRFLALDKGLAMERKILETHREVFRIGKILEKKELLKEQVEILVQ